MNKLFPIVLALMCFGLAQDEYPYFSDPLKQLAFEKKRIYIKEESGEKTLISGGDSYTELANPLGYIFLEQDPDYIAKNNPITTKVEYWYNFEIIRNNILLTEIEFLSIIGLADEVDRITLKYKKAIKDFSNKRALKDSIKKSSVIVNKGWLSFKFTPNAYSYVIDYTKNKPSYYNDLHINKPKKWLMWLSVLYLGSAYWHHNNYNDHKDYDGEYYADAENRRMIRSKNNYQKSFTLFSTCSLLWLSDILTEKERSIEKIEWKYPDYRKLESPIWKQTLSPDQIKSLADSYNRKVYSEIAE